MFQEVLILGSHLLRNYFSSKIQMLNRIWTMETLKIKHKWATTKANLKIMCILYSHLHQDLVSERVICQWIDQSECK